MFVISFDAYKLWHATQVNKIESQPEAIFHNRLISMALPQTRLYNIKSWNVCQVNEIFNK